MTLDEILSKTLPRMVAVVNEVQKQLMAQGIRRDHGVDDALSALQDEDFATLSVHSYLDTVKYESLFPLVIDSHLDLTASDGSTVTRNDLTPEQLELADKYEKFLVDVISMPFSRSYVETHNYYGANDNFEKALLDLDLDNPLHRAAANSLNLELANLYWQQSKFSEAIKLWESVDDPELRNRSPEVIQRVIEAWDVPSYEGHIEEAELETLREIAFSDSIDNAFLNLNQDKRLPYRETMMLRAQIWERKQGSQSNVSPTDYRDSPNTVPVDDSEFTNTGPTDYISEPDELILPVSLEEDPNSFENSLRAALDNADSTEDKEPAQGTSNYRRIPTLDEQILRIAPEEGTRLRGMLEFMEKEILKDYRANPDDSTYSGLRDYARNMDRHLRDIGISSDDISALFDSINIETLKAQIIAGNDWSNLEFWASSNLLNHPQTFEARGNAYQSIEKYDDAIEMYESAKSVDPTGLVIDLGSINANIRDIESRRAPSRARQEMEEWVRRTREGDDETDSNQINSAADQLVAPTTYTKIHLLDEIIDGRLFEEISFARNREDIEDLFDQYQKNLRSLITDPNLSEDDARNYSTYAKMDLTFIENNVQRLIGSGEALDAINIELARTTVLGGSESEISYLHSYTLKRQGLEDHPQMREVLGDAYQTRGNSKKAIELYEGAKASDPNGQVIDLEGIDEKIGYARAELRLGVPEADEYIDRPIRVRPIQEDPTPTFTSLTYDEAMAARRSRVLESQQEPAVTSAEEPLPTNVLPTLADILEASRLESSESGETNGYDPIQLAQLETEFFEDPTNKETREKLAATYSALAQTSGTPVRDYGSIDGNVVALFDAGINILRDGADEEIPQAKDMFERVLRELQYETSDSTTEVETSLPQENEYGIPNSIATLTIKQAEERLGSLETRYTEKTKQLETAKSLRDYHSRKRRKANRANNQELVEEHENYAGLARVDVGRYSGQVKRIEKEIQAFETHYISLIDRVDALMDTKGQDFTLAFGEYMAAKDQIAEPQKELIARTLGNLARIEVVLGNPVEAITLNKTSVGIMPFQTTYSNSASMLMEMD
jgi:tetratricopeptide (TPR) repeat protein